MEPLLCCDAPLNRSRRNGFRQLRRNRGVRANSCRPARRRWQPRGVLRLLPMQTGTLVALSPLFVSCSPSRLCLVADRQYFEWFLRAGRDLSPPVTALFAGASTCPAVCFSGCRARFM